MKPENGQRIVLIFGIIAVVFIVLLVLWYYFYPSPENNNLTPNEVKNGVPASGSVATKKANANGVLAGILTIVTALAGIAPDLIKNVKAGFSKLKTNGQNGNSGKTGGASGSGASGTNFDSNSFNNDFYNGTPDLFNGYDFGNLVNNYTADNNVSTPVGSAGNWGEGADSYELNENVIHG